MPRTTLAGAWSWSLCGLRELASRTVSLPDLALSLCGILRPKRLRPRVVVLRKPDGSSLLTDAQLPWADDAVALLQEVFWREARIRVVPADERMVEIMDEPGPGGALTARCGARLLRDVLSAPAAAFHRSICRPGEVTAIIIERPRPDSGRHRLQHTEFPRPKGP